MITQISVAPRGCFEQTLSVDASLLEHRQTSLPFVAPSLSPFSLLRLHGARAPPIDAAIDAAHRGWKVPGWRDEGTTDRATD